MTNDFYVKRSRKMLNHKAPHQKQRRVRNRKNNEDVNLKYLESTYSFIKWSIKLFMEDCIDIIKFWLILYYLSFFCKYFL